MPETVYTIEILTDEEPTANEIEHMRRKIDHAVWHFYGEVGITPDDSELVIYNIAVGNLK